MRELKEFERHSQDSNLPDGGSSTTETHRVMTEGPLRKELLQDEVIHAHSYTRHNPSLSCFPPTRSYIDSKVDRRGAPDGSDAGGGQHGLHCMDTIR